MGTVGVLVVLPHNKGTGLHIFFTLSWEPSRTFPHTQLGPLIDRDYTPRMSSKMLSLYFTFAYSFGMIDDPSTAKN